MILNKENNNLKNNLNFMVRTQMYMPDETYKFIKQEAKERNMSFAAYGRILFDKARAASSKKMTIQEKYPFIGMFKGGKNDSDNDEIDKFILDQSI